MISYKSRFNLIPWVWQMDGQTDKQTEILPVLHSVV